MSLSDESWDGAIYTEGTLRAVRSSSAINTRRRVERPTSKLSDSVAVTRKGLDRYRRSLRLLGLAVDNDEQRSNSRPQTRSAKSKIQTRLERRTVSSEDIKTALSDERKTEADCPSRGLVCRAVYEEWYFRKVEQARVLLDAKLQQEKIRRWQEDNEKKEKEKKGQLSYEEWVKKKDEEKNRQPNAEPKKLHGKAMAIRRPVSKEAAAEAYTKWKEEKLQVELKKKEEEKKKKLEEEEKERKRIEAEKVFESWKKRTEELMKKTATEAEQHRKLKEEDELKIKEQKEKENAASFRAWKESKDKEIKEKLDKQRKLEERKKAEEERLKNERKYEAHQAFQEWLDLVLEREEKRRVL